MLKELFARKRFVFVSFDPHFYNFDEPNKTFVVFLFAFGAILPQKLRVINNWLMIFLYGEEQQASPEGGWEWNGIKSPFKTDFEWFKDTIAITEFSGKKSPNLKTSISLRSNYFRTFFFSCR